jgi:hypothetical protein
MGRRFLPLAEAVSTLASISAIFQSKFGPQRVYHASNSKLGRQSVEPKLMEFGDRGRGTMKRTFAAATFLTLAAVMPSQQAVAQDPVGGAIVGGALGAIVGGAVGHGAGGAIAGGLIGATTGAVIAAEAQRRQSGYYWWRGGCYYRYPNGSWLQVQPGYCS